MANSTTLVCGEKQGTVTGSSRHAKAGDPPCDPCREARNANDRRRRAEYRANNPRQLLPCGTRAAYRRHLNNNEPACALCIEANQNYNRELSDHQTHGYSTPTYDPLNRFAYDDPMREWMA